MTDENIKLLRKDIEKLLSEEYGCNYRIINYDPRPNMVTQIFGISLKKRKMKAKFNREAYAKSIQVSEGENKQGADSLQTHKFQVADYSFHIKETSGKVLSCSEVWYK